MADSGVVTASRRVESLLNFVRVMADTMDIERLLSEAARAACGLLDCERARFVLGEKPPSGEGHQQLVVPMKDRDGRTLGLLEAGREPGSPFSVEEAEQAQLLAALAAIAVERQLLITEAQLKARLEREMERAREMVEALVPRTLPACSSYRMAGWLRHASLTGGDLYDAIDLSPDRFAFMVADATGHGIDSTLLVIECRAYFRSLLEHARQPEQLVERLNQLQCAAEGREDKFVTLFVGLVDRRTHRLDFVSAGHSPVLRYVAARETAELLAPHGPPVGVLSEVRYEAGRCPLEPGDLFLVATDGLVDLRGERGERYGEERLRERVEVYHDLRPRLLIDKLYVDALQFSGGAQQDDLTVLALKRTAA